MSKITKEAMERGIVKEGVFKTTDGGLYEDQNEAIAFQRILDFDEWYDSDTENQIDPNVDESAEGSEIYPIDVRNWLTENKAQVLRFLGV